MKFGTMTLKVEYVDANGATRRGELQSIAYDDATPKTYAKARAELEARRDGWRNYDKFRDAKFSIVEDTWREVAEVTSATEAGPKATARQYAAELAWMVRKLEAAKERAASLPAATTAASTREEWRLHVRALEKGLRAFRAKFPQFEPKSEAEARRIVHGAKR